MVNPSRKTVLVVENQPNYTQLLVKQLLFAGLSPVVAITGEGGLRKVAESHPDLILLEAELSDMDGMEFISLLRQNPEADRIPVVAMSAFPHLKSKCLERGCSDFLQKPIKMIELMTRLKKLLS
jgi:CheY-like chemotaxis protein